MLIEGVYQKRGQPDLQRNDQFSNEGEVEGYFPWSLMNGLVSLKDIVQLIYLKSFGSVQPCLQSL